MTDAELAAKIAELPLAVACLIIAILVVTVWIFYLDNRHLRRMVEMQDELVTAQRRAITVRDAIIDNQQVAIAGLKAALHEIDLAGFDHRGRPQNCRELPKADPARLADLSDTISKLFDKGEE
jgi:F420-0:gamma-glutamyl ligase-like protein